MESVYEQDVRAGEFKNGRMFKRKLDISWRAIFAGWLVAAAVAMVLYALGAATGISAIRFADPDSMSRKMLMSAAVWLVVTWVVSLSLGSYFASAVTRTVHKRTGGLQGIAIWALSSILTILVGVAGLGAVGLGSSFIAYESPADQERYKNPAVFQTQLKSAVTSKLKEEIKPETLALISAEFIRGDKESAKNALLLNTTLTTEEANSVVNDLSTQTREVKVKAKTLTDNVAFYTAVSLWLSVLASLLSLLGAMWAGKSGVREYIETNCGHSHKEAVGLKS